MTNSRQKGKRGELEVARELRRIFQTESIRSQQHSGQGLGPGDVILFDCEGNQLSVNIEVKRRESYSINKLLEWVEQARIEAGALNPAIVVHRKSNQPWMVTLLLDDLDLLVADLVYVDRPR